MSGKYILAESFDQVDKFLGSSKLIGFDTETTGLNPRDLVTCGVGLSPNGKDAIYIPITHVYTECFDEYDVMMFLKDRLKGCGLFIHNAKYDVEVVYQRSMREWDLWKTNKIIDTMILAYMYGRFARKGLKPLTKELYGYEMKELESFFGSKKKIHCEKLTGTQILDYACEDPVYTWKIGMDLLPKIKSSPMKFMTGVEMDLIKYVEKMERFGVRVDVNHLEKESQKLEDLLETAQNAVFKEVSEKVGEPVEFNLGSPADVGEVLYDLMGFPVLGTTATGKRSTDQKTLNKMAAKYSVVRNILTWKRIKKAKSSYTDPLPSYAEVDGKIHSSFNQTAAASGRFGSSDPNLQNLPSPGRDPFKLVIDGESKEFNVNVRKAIVAEEGYYFFDPDYSQIEYKGLVGEAGETSFIRAFDNGVDFHTQTANLIGKDRDTAKTTNFRLQYMGGPSGLAEALEITLEEAKEIMRIREESMPAVGVYRQNALINMRRSGYVQTRFGRRRYDNNLFSDDRKQRAFTERSMYNTLIQGAAADVLKQGIVNLGKLIDERYGEDWDKVRMLLTVHDEILLEVRDDIPMKDIDAMCKEAMEIPVDGWPKITVDAKYGKSWGDMKKYDSDEEIATKPVCEPLQDAYKSLGVIPTPTIPTNQKMDDTSCQKIILDLKEELTSTNLGALLKVLDDRPGSNLFVIRTPEKDWSLDKHRSSVGLDNAGLINTAIACDVTIDSSDIDVSVLL